MTRAVRFGTDGIRGRALDEVTIDLAYRLGHAVASVFDAPVFVGYDTRESSPPLAAAVLAGLHDARATGVNLGPFTTPGVAVIAHQRAGAGVVVSASHNPYYDNGLKVLGIGGGKISQDIELALTLALVAAPTASTSSFVAPSIDELAQHAYASHLRRLVPRDLSSLHVVLDCANGAASHVAHELFTATGAKVTMLHDQPNGRNINEACGSTHVDDLVATVSALGADLGLAFDGDADRLIAVDANGTVRDGDDLLVLFALDLQRREMLGGGLVVTTMSNLGLHRALAERDIEIVETDVGDRNVVLALEERAWALGGEQSGHLIFRTLAPSGDGLLTGLLLADLVVRNGPLFDQATALWHRVPQALVNVSYGVYDDLFVHALFDELCARYQIAAPDVRLLVRPSGTEPVVRVMIEALDATFVHDFTQRLLGHFLA